METTSRGLKATVTSIDPPVVEGHAIVQLGTITLALLGAVERGDGGSMRSVVHSPRFP
jgi:hypothetical protein